MILFICADLLWATRIKSTAESVGVAARPARTLEMLEARLADSPVHALVVDLEAGDTGLGLIERLRGPEASEAERAITVLAFGPHVMTDLFAQARAAGADRVVARGGFAAQLPQILRTLDDVAAP